MKCPRCVSEVPHAAPSCGNCGYSLADSDAHFGDDSVALSRVTDSNGRFSEKEIKQIEKALDQFEKTFPQLFLSVYSLALPVGSSLRQFGFWMLNRAAISPLEITRPNEQGAMLVLEETSGQASLVVGYLLECYFREDELQEIVGHGKASWNHGKMAAGVLAVVKSYTAALKKKILIARKDPSQFDPRPPAEPTLPEFHPLHDQTPQAPNAKESQPKTPSGIRRLKSNRRRPR